MNEDRLRRLLGKVPVPDEERAERRGLAVVRAAFAARQPAAGRPALPRLAAALAALTLFAALALSPAGAAVRDWIGDALTVGVRDAEPALTEIPGGGRLLVSSPQGSWVVQPDGSRRLLGDYPEAAWSPRGLFVVTASGHMLSAVEPDGTVRWSLSTDDSVTDMRWSPSGVRIAYLTAAYRTGSALRVVAGDGSGDALIDGSVAPVAPVWLPRGQHLLAYVDAGDTLRIVNPDTGKTLGSAPASGTAVELDWAHDGSRLLEATTRSLRLRDVTVSKLSARLSLGPPRDVALPPAMTVRAAAFSPDGRSLAVIGQRLERGRRPGHSELYLMSSAGTSRRLLFTGPGLLSTLDWSPDGRRLLIAWPEADQWLFIPAQGRGRVRAIGGISSEFAPGDADSAVFPLIDGWCCAATVGIPRSP
jgi:dipeptidyl aminopeptidase/acylaminoacyl peptidase